MTSIKSKLKEIVRYLFVILAFPLILFFYIFSFITDKDSLFRSIGQLISLLPGKSGSLFRVSFYSTVNSKISSNIYIDFGSYFSHYEVIVGDGVYIGAYSIIGMANIGNNCAIGSNVNLLSGKNQHTFTDIHTPILQQGGTFNMIIIGEDCWIGNGAIVMESIGCHSIIGAGSIVTSKLESLGIYAGAPAKLIKKRE